MEKPEEPQMNETKPEKARISKGPLLMIGGLLVLLVLSLGAVAYLYSDRIPDSQTTDATPTPIVSQEPTTAEEVSSLKTYVEEDNNWQLSYPKDLKVQVHGKEQIGQGGIGNVVNFSELGPTQAEGTEFYDGLSFTVGVKEKSKDQTLMEFADKDSTPSDPEVSSRTALKTIEVNGHDGVETTIKGLGEVRVIYLEYPILEDRVYYITIFSAGPGESQKEYDLIVENMLNSFKSYR